MPKTKKITLKSIDWGEKQYIKALTEERKFMWNKDYVALLAKLIGFKPGKTIADIGCGLGFLGHLFSKFVIPHGKYIGVDSNPKLLELASKSAAIHKSTRFFRFIQGSAFDIPLKDKGVPE